MGGLPDAGGVREPEGLRATSHRSENSLLVLLTGRGFSFSQKNENLLRVGLYARTHASERNENDINTPPEWGVDQQDAMQQRRQGIYWLLTLPASSWEPPREVPDSVAYLRGQREVGEGTGYEHWQVLAVFSNKVSLSVVRRVFGKSVHAELSRSEAADEYVWKEATRVDGTQFELGSRPSKRNSKKDWDAIWSAAVAGDLQAIPASVRVQSYRTLRAICSDHEKPVGMVRTCHVYWGPTGTGKSRAAWEAASVDAYPKDPRTKFWCGYQGQANVVIDEFRGGIDIGHVLRWLDRYPVIVEVKGSSRRLDATDIWITSNLHPRDWYPELDDKTLDALMRRLIITEFPQI